MDGGTAGTDDGTQDDGLAWIDRYLDAGMGQCWFRAPKIAALVVQSLLHGDGHAYSLGGYVVMPNHVHAIVQPAHCLSSVLQRWKSFTAHAVNRCVQRRGRLWQEESFDRLIRDEMELVKFEQYIADNPRVAQVSAGGYALGRGAANWKA